MIRWSYLVPRLIILGLILVAVWISADPLLKFAIINSTQSVTGAKVEVGQVKSSLLNGKIYLKDVAISDPRNPMQNLIQADIAYLQLNPQRLLHRQLVIEHGHSTQVMFGAPRTESGELPDRDYPFEDLTSWLPDGSLPNAANTARNWMDNLQTSVTNRAIDNLETVKVSKELQEKWPPIFEQKRSEIESLQSLITSLKTKIETPLQNPLRDLDELTKAIEQVNSLQKQLSTARREMTDLVNAANSDLERLRQAQIEDTAAISSYAASPIDPETFSQLLLAKDQAGRLKEAINWVRWFRNSIPDPEKDFYPKRHRGTDIAFQGEKEHPEFLIKTLELEGQGTLSDKHFNFAGVAKDLSTQPSLHDQPATFELRAQGEHHLIVNCTIDRRDSVSRDRMEITCPDLEIPGQNLGDGKTLVVQMNPSRVQAEVDIEISGDQISGTLRFRHSNCSLYLDKIDNFAGGQDMQLRLNQELAQIREFSTVATLSGTLQDPKLSFTSDLGRQFAASMNRILKDQADQQVASFQRQVHQRYQEELDNLNQMFKSNFDGIKRQLNGEAAIVTELINIIPDLQDWPSIRR